jgi:hypothetical protein
MLMDIRGDLLSVGEPLIHHRKEDTHEGVLKNIRQEHYAHIVNLQFCDLVQQACEGIASNDYLSMYEAFVENLEDKSSSFPAALKTYMIPTYRKMRLWVTALRHGIV